MLNKWMKMRKMERKIIAYIALILVSGSIILIHFYSRMLKSSEIASEKELMQTIVSQVIVNLNHNNQEKNEARELFVNDYLNRAKIVRTLVLNNEGQTDWEEIIKIVDVDSVNIVDKNGIIEDSSNVNNIGLNFYEYPQLESFTQVIEHQQDYHIEFDSLSINSGELMIYIGVEVYPKGMIQLGVKAEILSQYEKLASIKEYIKNIPTKWSRTLFLAECDGNYTNIVSNNTEEVVIENCSELFELALDKPIEVTLNAKKQLLLTTKYENFYIGYASQISELYRISESYIISFIRLLIILSILIVFCLYWILNKLVLKDIKMITQQAHLFVNGHSGIVFKKARTSELNQLSDELNKVINAIESKNERISSIVSMMDKKMEAYEYYADLNQVYFSKTLPELLGLTFQECEQKIIEFFNIYSQSVNENQTYSDEETIYTKTGRFIKVKRTIIDRTAYGFLEDVTEEMTREKELLKSLENEKQKSSTDVLTGLYNRSKLQNCIEHYLKNDKNHNGIIVLMDLDNFKTINDYKGHQEGDRLLLLFSKILLQQFRDSDIVARLGGDEFVIFIPNYIKPSAFEQKLDNFLNIMREQLEYYYRCYKLSISIGAVYLNQKYTSFDQIYQSADEAMYQAKRKGKDGYYIKRF